MWCWVNKLVCTLILGVATHDIKVKTASYSKINSFAKPCPSDTHLILYWVDFFYLSFSRLCSNLFSSLQNLHVVPFPLQYNGSNGLVSSCNQPEWVSCYEDQAVNSWGHFLVYSQRRTGSNAGYGRKDRVLLLEIPIILSHESQISMKLGDKFI